MSLKACEGDFSRGVDQPGGSPDHLAASPGARPFKKRVTMYMDADVLAWFKSRGRWYQREINRMLRRVMMEEKDAE